MTIVFTPYDQFTAEWWFRERQEAETLKFNPLAPSSVETLSERLSKTGSDFQTFAVTDSFFWLVKKDNQIVGQVSLQNINRAMLTAEIGYGISSHCRGQGLATLAIQKLAKDAFTMTPLRKLVAYVHEQNVPSRKALERAGFRLEGLLREHYLIHGKPVNEAIYGLLRSD